MTHWFHDRNTTFHLVRKQRILQLEFEICQKLLTKWTQIRNMYLIPNAEKYRCSETTDSLFTLIAQFRCTTSYKKSTISKTGKSRHSQWDASCKFLEAYLLLCFTMIVNIYFREHSFSISIRDFNCLFWRFRFYVIQTLSLQHSKGSNTWITDKEAGKWVDLLNIVNRPERFVRFSVSLDCS